MLERPAPSAPEWYALLVKPRVERYISQLLTARGFEVFLPSQPLTRKRGGRTVVLDRPLFPSYLFVHFSWGDRLAALTTPGVRSIVSFSGVPARIPQDEIDRLQRLVTSEIPVVACDYLQSGLLVQVKSGPLKGLQGTLVEIKSHLRLVINIDILQRAVAVEIDRLDVVPLARAHSA